MSAVAKIAGLTVAFYLFGLVLVLLALGVAGIVVAINREAAT